MQPTSNLDASKVTGYEQRDSRPAARGRSLGAVPKSSEGMEVVSVTKTSTSAK